MALRHNITLGTDHVLATAYIRIHSLTLDVDGARAVADISVYASAQARLDGDDPIERRGISKDVANFANVPADPIGWLYVHMKTLAEYAGATDV